jgi:hypothetical protein
MMQVSGGQRVNGVMGVWEMFDNVYWIYYIWISIICAGDLLGRAAAVSRWNLHLHVQKWTFIFERDHTFMNVQWRHLDRLRQIVQTFRNSRIFEKESDSTIERLVQATSFCSRFSRSRIEKMPVGCLCFNVDNQSTKKYVLTRHSRSGLNYVRSLTVLRKHKNMHKMVISTMNVTLQKTFERHPKALLLQDLHPNQSESLLFLRYFLLAWSSIENISIFSLFRYFLKVKIF